MFANSTAIDSGTEKRVSKIRHCDGKERHLIVLSMNFKFSLTIKWMNCDLPIKKKKTLATGAPGKKAEKKNQQRAGGVFFSLRKNARSHDGNFAVHFGKQAAPPRTTGHSLSPSFMRLPMGCVGGPCPSNTANGEAFTPNSTVGPRGASGQNSLSNSSRG